ncbi:carbohydrate ABC transporter permease [Paenibacillus cymbidii]|uniref:carbohydrate ABC transporter permease n=1 Tax=Paenibacillus cymbidii TaxID=1639034 RepID=UPI001081E273|nr:carbohydrate ABC transporter permease [Paenibacillus cymbidii]
MKHAVNAFFIVLSLAFVFPLALIVSISLSSEQSLLNDGYLLIPREISFQAYHIIFKQPQQLLHAYEVTIAVTAIGTVAGLLFTAMIAFTLSRKDYAFRKFTTVYIVIPMLFSGGLVPFYIMVSQYLHLKDTLPALILPGLISPFYILIMKGFLDKLPGEMFDSAKMDGAGEFRLFATIVLPLSTPALATIGLFISFSYWNDWWLGLLFIDNKDLVPLQLLLYRIMNSINFMTSEINKNIIFIDMSQFPSLSTRMAMAVLAAGPMMFVFPFFQRYFVSGLTVGSVKN